MATRKKPKAKPKKAVKKSTKKPVRKSPVRRAPPKTAKPLVPPPPPLPGERIGIVTHYYGNVSVAVVKLESGSLRVGDTIHVRGHTSDFTQRVESLQIGHAPVSEVGPNDDFGLKVIAQVREHDIVYKVK